MKTRFLQIAEIELREAFRHYQQIRPDLGADFRSEVNSALDRIEQLPHAWSLLGKDVRICRTHRFPYGLVYQTREDEALIIAVMHLHRRPGYWKKRIQK
jgi:mRNA-degrading endonuclease RelE of RelBE toxin-antitoxin system